LRWKWRKSARRPNEYTVRWPKMFQNAGKVGGMAFPLCDWTVWERHPPPESMFACRARSLRNDACDLAIKKPPLAGLGVEGVSRYGGRLTEEAERARPRPQVNEPGGSCISASFLLKVRNESSKTRRDSGPTALLAFIAPTGAPVGRFPRAVRICLAGRITIQTAIRRTAASLVES
jgi:hypothetical protein